MRGLALVIVLAALAPGAPAAAAPTGVIKGTVINGSTGEPQPGVQIRLTSATAAGSDEITETATTGGRGGFRFEGLTTGDDRYYTVDARYERGLFAGGVVRLPSDTTRTPVIETELSVWRTTTDPSSIVIARHSLFVVPRAGGAGVVESVRVSNTSARAYIGRAPRADGGSPSLAFALPAAADGSGLRILDATIDIPEIRPSELGFTTTVAIPPGRETRVTFTYPIEGSTGQFDLSRRVLYPVIDHSIYLARPLTLQSDRMAPRGEVELGGKTYARWSSPDPLEAGDSVQALALAEAGWDPGLVGGSAALLAAIAGAVAFALMRRRRGVTAPAATDRQELLTAIADLDLRHRSGELSDEHWEARRDELKRRLRELPRPEPAARR